MKRIGVLLDRDGVVIVDAHYLADPAQIRLIEGAAQAIARLNARQLPVVIVTNQSGVARGYYNEADVLAMHQQIDRLLAEHGARIDRYYYCPHHASAGQGKYRVDCDCRKPAAGMLRQAALDLGFELAGSFMVGDKACDLEAAAAAPCRPLLVRTGYGKQTEQELGPQLRAEQVCDDLPAAVALILDETGSPS